MVGALIVFRKDWTSWWWWFSRALTCKRNMLGQAIKASSTDCERVFAGKTQKLFSLRRTSRQRLRCWSGSQRSRLDFSGLESFFMVTYVSV